jgi:hypothetical protein
VFQWIIISVFILGGVPEKWFFQVITGRDKQVIVASLLVSAALGGGFYPL